jgi:amino acid adenylation domain-containing protein
MSYIYKSGDLARWQLDGNIEFLGRIDNQVKIRGYRIELEEIEKHLLRHHCIKEAAVIAKRNKAGEKHLCAYIVPISKGPAHRVTVPQLREYLAKGLPGYMIPGFYIELDEIPYTSHGKLDQKALPGIDAGLNTGTEHVEPRDEMEKTLVKMWTNILGIKRIGINDNFFDLGGQSLLGMKFISMVNKAFQVKIQLLDLFREKNIGRIAKRISDLQSRNREEENVQKSGLIRPFDLGKAPILRASLIKLQPRRHLLVIDMHHIVTDGNSIDILVNEFIQFYRGRELPRLPLQYKDYSLWHNDFINSKWYLQQERYWLDCFKGNIPRLNIPLDYPRTAERKGVGDSLHINVEKELTAKLHTFCAEHEVTLFMLMMAIYSILMAKYADQEDIVIGIPVAGRNTAGFERIIGMFVNTLAIRSFPQAELTFFQFLKNIKKICLQALENQDYQFDMLVSKLNLSGDTSRNPLFDTMFTLINLEEQEYDLGEELKITPLDPGFAGAMFDLTLTASVTRESIKLIVNYDSALFKEDTIQTMLNRFLNSLFRFICLPGQTIGELSLTALDEDPGHYPLEQETQEHMIRKNSHEEFIDSFDGELSSREREKILFQFNDTAAALPPDKTFHHLFIEQLQKTPDYIAVVHEDIQFSYALLDREANRLARTLRKNGVTPGTIVSLLVDRSLDMFVGLLGILKAGGAYLPLDPNFPEERMKYMLADSNVTVLLTMEKFINKIAGRDDLIILPIDDKALYGEDNSGFPCGNNPQDPAYAIYTSGSTGKPKGIIIEHQNVVNFFTAMTSCIDFNEAKSILAVTTISFDIFVLEFLLPLVKGMKIVLALESHQVDPYLLGQLILSRQVNMLQLTPSRLQLVLTGLEKAGALSFITDIMVGGEAFPAYLFDALKARYEGKIHNMYGPTETTIWSTVKDLTNDDVVTIGTPVANTQVYIMDRDNQPLPIGVPGELCIGGDGVGRGYMNRPVLTSEKFIDNPLFPGEKLYQTGDLAKWLPDGNIVFMGRIDRQVKIRGYRIELGEIEDALLQHSSIKEAVVESQPNQYGQGVLMAYIVSQQDITVKSLRAYLSGKLSSYMIPSVFIPLDKIPLTTNGKVDRQALAKIDPRISTGSEYVAPRNDIETRIALTWASVLIKTEPIGIYDSFFDLGGDSLKATLVAAKIERDFNIRISVKDIFDVPTIDGLVKVMTRSVEISRADAPAEPVETKEYYPATSNQKRQYILHHLKEQDVSYNIPGVVLLEGNLDKERLLDVLKKILKRHESLRTGFEMKDGKIIQKVYENIDPQFQLDVFEVDAEDVDIAKILKGEIPLHKGTRTPEPTTLAAIKLKNPARRMEVL